MAAKTKEVRELPLSVQARVVVAYAQHVGGELFDEVATNLAVATESFQSLVEVREYVATLTDSPADRITIYSSVGLVSELSDSVRLHMAELEQIRVTRSKDISEWAADVFVAGPEAFDADSEVAQWVADQGTGALQQSYARAGRSDELATLLARWRAA